MFVTPAKWRMNEAHAKEETEQTGVRVLMETRNESGHYSQICATVHVRHKESELRDWRS